MPTASKIIAIHCRFDNFLFKTSLAQLADKTALVNQGEEESSTICTDYLCRILALLIVWACIHCISRLGALPCIHFKKMQMSWKKIWKDDKWHQTIYHVTKFQVGIWSMHGETEKTNTYLTGKETQNKPMEKDKATIHWNSNFLVHVFCVQTCRMLDCIRTSVECAQACI